MHMHIHMRTHTSTATYLNMYEPQITKHTRVHACTHLRTRTFKHACTATCTQVDPNEIQHIFMVCLAHPRGPQYIIKCVPATLRPHPCTAVCTHTHIHRSMHAHAQAARTHVINNARIHICSHPHMHASTPKQFIERGALRIPPHPCTHTLI